MPFLVYFSFTHFLLMSHAFEYTERSLVACAKALHIGKAFLTFLARFPLCLLR